MITTPNPYAHILHPIADGVDRFQIIPLQSDGTWQLRNASQMLEMIQRGHVPPEHMRVEPRTITINGREVPEPLRKAPAPGTEVYMPHLSDTRPVCRLMWQGDSHQQTLLARGLLHTTEQNCAAHADALLSFTTTLIGIN